MWGGKSWVSQSCGRGRGKPGSSPRPAAAPGLACVAPYRTQSAAQTQSPAATPPASPPPPPAPAPLSGRQQGFGVGCRGGSPTAAQWLATAAGIRCLDNWGLSAGPGALINSATLSTRALAPPQPPRDPVIPDSVRLTLTQQSGQHQAQCPVPRRPPRGRALEAHRGHCHATHRQLGPRAGCPMPGAAPGSAPAPAAARALVQTTFLGLQPRSC